MSGFSYACEKLTERWGRRGCTMVGDKPEPRCRKLKAKLDASSCTADKDVEKCTSVAGFTFVTTPGGESMCLRFYPASEGKTYSDADAECKASGAELVVAKTKEVLEFLVAQVPGKTPSFWIGLDDLEKEHEYVWSDGSLLSMGDDSPLWGPRPAVHLSEHKLRNCVVNGGGAIWDGNCATTRPFMCSLHTEEEEEEEELTGADKCTAGFMFTTTQDGEPMCLRFYPADQGKNYQDAKEECRVNGAELVVAKTQDLLDFIVAKVPENPGSFWIGLDDLKNEQDYVWSDGSLLSMGDDSPLWGPRPTGHLAEHNQRDCVVTNEGAKIWDGACSVQRPFLCQLPV